jgi:hypothetical protein
LRNAPPLSARWYIRISTYFMKMQPRLVVNEEVVKKNIRLNLERLHRQYLLSVKQYDEVSLLDLSHALRQWVDMRDSVQDYLTQYRPAQTFSTYALRPDLLKACHGAKYIVAYFVKGVTTYASGNALLSFVYSLGGQPNRTAFGVRPLSGGGLIATYLYCIGESRIQYDYDPATAFRIQETSFKGWLDAEVVRVRFMDNAQKLHDKIINRVMLIKRVANNLGGSHPAGVFEVAHTYDKAVKFLLDYKIGGIPLPYYILLKSAHDILEGFDYWKKE